MFVANVMISYINAVLFLCCLFICEFGVILFCSLKGSTRRVCIGEHTGPMFILEFVQGEFIKLQLLQFCSCSQWTFELFDPTVFFLLFVALKS